MEYQNVFKRYEIKYMLDPHQKEMVLAAMAPYMEPDEFGHTTIRNLYYDTDSYRLARTSIEKPEYKEKLRVRSYSETGPDSPVFVELKKKYDSVVYKRRISLPEKSAEGWLAKRQSPGSETQITREIDYFVGYYGTLKPVACISYERDAYRGREIDLRITFDRNILTRSEDMNLSDVWGRSLLPEGMTLMEVKCPGSMPLWLTRVLTREKIFRTSFSKYGTAYQTVIYPGLKEA